MTKPIISVENLSKLYQLGQARQSNKTFREMLSDLAKLPLRSENQKSEKESFWALSDVSFELAQGDVLGIIGRNGAGKSTLLKILSRIVEPTKGRAVMRGRVASLLEVGTGFHPELTGRENIFLNGAILGMKKVELDRKFDEIVEFSGVEKFLDTPVKRYSSGMYVRLAFAVAAHLEPDILIVDEVLAVGDAQFQEKCIGKMKEVGRTEGRTVLFVSHNMPAVRSMCQRAILLDGGKIISSGDAEFVVGQYTNAGLLEIRHEKTWELSKAPGSDAAKITKVSIEGARTPRSGTAHLDEPLTITVEYQVLIPQVRLNIAAQLYDKQDIMVFSSASMTDEKWYGQPHPVGRYVSKCTIPGDMLNDGHYYISAMLVQDQGHALGIAEKQVTIEMIDTGAGRHAYYGEWAGAIRPRLQWQTEKSVVDDQAKLTPTRG